MEASYVPISSAINKPKLDWLNTKLEAFRRLTDNNKIRENEEFASLYPRCGNSIFVTVDRLLALYKKKFERGETSGFRLKFTYGYFKQHCMSTLSIRTFINHFNTIAKAYKSIFKIRERDVLKLKERDCNCVAIEFSPGIIQYTNPSYSKLHEDDPAPNVVQLNVTDKRILALRMPQTGSPSREGGTKKISSLISGFFKK
jgi:hypothetical protein